MRHLSSIPVPTLILVFVFIISCKEDIKPLIQSEKITCYRAEVVDGNVRKGIRVNGEASDELGQYIEYDKMGKTLQYIYYDSLGSIENNFIYSYDSEGNKKLTTNYNKEGLVRWKSEFQYNSLGKETSNTMFDANGSIVQWSQKVYNKKGNLIKDSGYGPDSLLFLETKSSYDKLDRVIEEVVTIWDYNRKPSISNYRFTYDKSGRKIKQRTDSEEFPDLAITEYYKYNKNDLLKEIKWALEELDEEGGTTEIIYDYNSEGLWISMIKSENGYPKYIIERELAYH